MRRDPVAQAKSVESLPAPRQRARSRSRASHRLGRTLGLRGRRVKATDDPLATGMTEQPHKVDGARVEQLQLKVQRIDRRGRRRHAASAAAYARAASSTAFRRSTRPRQDSCTSGSRSRGFVACQSTPRWSQATEKVRGGREEAVGRRAARRSKCGEHLANLPAISRRPERPGTRDRACARAARPRTTRPRVRAGAQSRRSGRRGLGQARPRTGVAQDRPTGPVSPAGQCPPAHLRSHSELNLTLYDPRVDRDLDPGLQQLKDCKGNAGLAQRLCVDLARFLDGVLDQAACL